MFNNLFGGGMGGMGGAGQGGQRMKFNVGGGGGGGIEDILMGGVCALYAFSKGNSNFLALSSTWLC